MYKSRNDQICRAILLKKKFIASTCMSVISEWGKTYTPYVTLDKTKDIHNRPVLKQDENCEQVWHNFKLNSWNQHSWLAMILISALLCSSIIKLCYYKCHWTQHNMYTLYAASCLRYSANTSSFSNEQIGKHFH